MKLEELKVYSLSMEMGEKNNYSRGSLYDTKTWMTKAHNR